MIAEPSKSTDLTRISIRIRQQPLHARACGYGTKDRRALDPAPIIEVLYDNEPPNDLNTLYLVLISYEIHPFLILRATLWTVSEEEQPIERKDHLLSGAIVTNSTILRDHTGIHYLQRNAGLLLHFRRHIS